MHQYLTALFGDTYTHRHVHCSTHVYFIADEMLETQGTWLRSGPTKNSDPSVHSGTVCSGQHRKAAWVSMDGWIHGWMEKMRCVCAECWRRGWDRQGWIGWYCLCVEFRKVIQVNLFVGQRQTHGHGRQTCGCSGRRRGTN